MVSNNPFLLSTVSGRRETFEDLEEKYEKPTEVRLPSSFFHLNFQ